MVISTGLRCKGLDLIVQEDWNVFILKLLIVASASFLKRREE